MSIANVLFVLVLVCLFATLGTLFAGLVEGTVEGGRRSNRLMWWRVRLQFLTIALIVLWFFASRS